MLHSNYSTFHAVAGGILIGLASLIASAATGKIPGISGIFSRILRAKKGDTAWRVVFIVGLVAGSALVFALMGPASTYRPVRSIVLMGFAGVLVGFGTRISGGCTSGHGVCGVGLGSRNGIVATLLFMASGMITVYLLNHLIGVPLR